MLSIRKKRRHSEKSSANAQYHCSEHSISADKKFKQIDFFTSNTQLNSQTEIGCGIRTASFHQIFHKQN